ncbi:hypothetical protein [Adlercreutzia murintestinalis]|uniref:hypothetical protein n=1 Tax=Adlercreutzia murintestinalis TaxID=2941325 RepID=UPI00203CF09D|nr:hypothetical protein [Adlercreutzia murintestinalis]
MRTVAGHAEGEVDWSWNARLDEDIDAATTLLFFDEVQAYYWGQQSTYKVDFVVRSSEGIVPIEVKSGERVKATSARRFAEKYDCPFLVHMTAKNVGETDSVRSIPLYAACLLDTL